MQLPSKGVDHRIDLDRIHLACAIAERRVRIVAGTGSDD